MLNQPEKIVLYDITNQPQSSTLDNIVEQAVCVRHAYKHYGTKNNTFVVLDDLNMTVPKGIIYGLLGASGCGKTTVIECMIGRKKFNSGEVFVLNCTPGAKGSGVPGVRVGYMPQELQLFGEFSIRETLHYFGGIAGMTNKKIEERLTFFVQLLLLPNVNEFVVNLSGGQQRRVSLAAAMLHEPELLILDEPTVGADPLLREMIWSHLMTITQSGSTTVIITTHYIDETQDATLIGLMRGGYLLAEETPTNLLSLYNTTSLEEVFLRLSAKQNLTEQEGNGFVYEAADFADIAGIYAVKGFVDNLARNRKQPERKPTQLNHVQMSDPKKKISHYFPALNGNHIKTLIWSNCLWLLRNWTFLCLVFGLPIIQMILLCLAIGHAPRGLTVAVVNHETGNALECNATVACNSTILSCVYLDYLQKNDLNLVYYDTEYTAAQSVLKGETYASIVIRHNYSKALQARIENWRYTHSWDIKASEIDVMRDVRSKDIAMFLKMYLYDSFQKLIQGYLNACEINTHVMSVPIQWKQPVYGFLHPNFTDFMSPGLILVCIFMLSVTLTITIMIVQIRQGITERSLIMGVTQFELLITHTFCQLIMMMVQVFSVLVCVFGIFKMTMNGSYVLLTSICLMTGFCGMCFGFCISSAVDSERSGTYVSVGSFAPLVFLSGSIWPTEGQHYILQTCSFLFPLTTATEALRSILQRGWGLSFQTVYMGFISITVWAATFLILSTIMLKFKKQ